MTTSGRYSRRALGALAAYLAHATYGIEVRCAAINTAEADGYELPEAWNHEATQDHDVPLEYPFVQTRYHGMAEQTPPGWGNNEYGCKVSALLWLARFDINGDPTIGQTLLTRLEQAAMECLTWREVGRTLGGSDTRILGVSDIRCEPVQRLYGAEYEVGIGLKVSMTVRVEETDIVTS